MEIEVIAKDKTGEVPDNVIQKIAAEIIPLLFREHSTPEDSIKALGVCLSGLVQIMAHKFPELTPEEHKQVALDLFNDAMNDTTLEISRMSVN